MPKSAALNEFVHASLRVWVFLAASDKDEMGVEVSKIGWRDLSK